jgi:hypothetical protein
MPNFNFYNVEVKKAETSNQMVVRGDIENRSGRSYNAVAIRIVLFVKNIPVTNTVVVVNGIPNTATKSFEKYVEDLDYTQVGKDITRWDIYTESAY